jgi:hypothetical protein
MLKTRSVSLLTCQLRVNGRGDVLPTGLGSFALRLFFPALVVCNLVLMSSVPVSAVPIQNKPTSRPPLFPAVGIGRQANPSRGTRNPTPTTPGLLHGSTPRAASRNPTPTTPGLLHGSTPRAASRLRFQCGTALMNEQPGNNSNTSRLIETSASTVTEHGCGARGKFGRIQAGAGRAMCP